MKTSEEIKKGLEHCEKEMCKKCPYEADCNMEDAFTVLSFDAIALIQQLEAENAELLEKVKQLERERDAAVADLATIHKCEPCKHRTSNSYISNECLDCVNFCNFEWRGPCEENTENP